VGISKKQIRNKELIPKDRLLNRRHIAKAFMEMSGNLEFPAWAFGFRGILTGKISLSYSAFGVHL